MLAFAFLLLVVYQLKHFFADYPLQTKFMLGKFKPGWDFLGPLLAHVGVHGAFTLAICLVLVPSLWWLALVDAGVHFVMDRLKAGPKYLGRFKALSGKEFMDNMAAQQDIHRITKHYADQGVKYDGNIQYLQGLVRNNTYFWWSLGLDQMVHHLTHYYVIWKLVMSYPYIVLVP